MSKILLAEDEEVLRMLIVDTLEDEEYEIDEATDGGEALELIHQNDYDLILIDYMMPVMTGLEVIEKVREIPDKSQVKIVMLSAKNQQTDKERVTHAGADYFISKPFSPMELVTKIGEILSD
ncbi:response regulator [Anaerobacillus alkalilacustris]|uniref:Response regulator n=1 Tax=Anaerobacillus alkalilacustris TaxID=393763 RepID=A0A1S2LHN5_9BACI|nr:response regulator [Anaerobacillus alkalilacustris]OIJ11824.1 response regulator [Anaerobacillus alkalilacustris]